jgi:hypothetical protein
MDYKNYSEELLYNAYHKLLKKAQRCQELQRNCLLSKMATEIMSCLIQKRKEFWRKEGAL